MAKRGAGTELNDRNWDAEEEPEEAGIFTQAAKDVLEQRTIKKAKRRVAGDETGSKPSAFSGFAGFGDKKTAPSTGTFSGFKKIDGDAGCGVKSSVFGGTSSINGAEDKKLKGQGNSRESSSYLCGLKSLNESVLAWIKQHVDNNPYIILTPVFKDYEKYLEVIKSDKSSVVSTSPAEDDSNDNQSPENVTTVSTKSTSSAANSSIPEDDGTGKPLEASKPKTFSFAQSTAEVSKAFTFGQSTTQSSASGFSFAPSAGSTGAAVKFTSASSIPGAGFFFNQTSTAGSSSLFGKSTLSSSGSTNTSQGLFSFGKTNAQHESSSAENAQKDGCEQDEEYEPPKPEVKDIVEADALYSKRCKLYYQKDGQWVDRGVGNLHLKPVVDNKTQLLVRADTNLGNVLLNIMLSSSTPVSRQGKNNVVLVCVPNPALTTSEDQDTPIPMLIRVKTGEDADELLEKIDDRKKLL